MNDWKHRITWPENRGGGCRMSDDGPKGHESSPPPWASIRDAALIRDPQPTDVLVIEVEHCTPEVAYAMKHAITAELGCRVLIVSGARVATFTTTSTEEA